MLPRNWNAHRKCGTTSKLRGAVFSHTRFILSLGRVRKYEQTHHFHQL